MKCPDCENEINRIERYHVTVVWEKVGGHWKMGCLGNGTHFHLFCPDYDEYSKSGKHESKLFGNDLPDELKKVVFEEAPQ